MSLALSTLHSRDRVNIVEPGRLHPAVSFARASTATYMGPAGTLLTAAVNAPRYEYDSAGNYLGLLIEEARTNLLIRSNDLITGTSWSKTGAGTGSAPVITSNYAISPDESTNANRVILALNGGKGVNDQSSLEGFVTTITGAPYAQSVWLKSNTSSSYILQLSFSGNTVKLITVTPQWQRFTNILPSAVDTIRRLRLALRGSASTSDYADIQFFGAQQETGTLTTSYIPTTGAAVTRSADVESTALTALGISTTQGVFVVEHDTPSGRPVLYTGANKILDSAGGGKVAIAYDGSGIRMSRNGAAITTGAAITWVSTLDFNAGMNAHIKRLTWYRTKRADSELQRLTA